MNQIVESVWSSDLDGLRRQLQAGANPNYYHEHLTPLLWAIRLNQPNMADLLLDFGADPGAVDKRYMQNAIHAGVSAQLPTPILNRLLLGNDVNKGDNTGMTPLMLAAKSGSRELVSYLLANGADPRIYDRYSNGPLHWSATGGEFPELNLYLIKNGADPGARTSYGMTYLDILREMKTAKG